MKLWGGRFNKETDKIAEAFHSSISFDKRLYQEDIEGSLAHVKMLGDCKIISKIEAKKIREGLLTVKDAIESGEIELDIAAEDIHMNIETLLINKIGDVGRKLHTARSRNDQVALDLRLWLRKEIKEIQILILSLISSLVNKAELHINTIMPGYTHLQKAQPISFAHHLLAYIQMFQRDYLRLSDCSIRMNYSPLGDGALAGTTFSIDRNQTAKELGFRGPTLNSLDGVSDRDFGLEFLSNTAIVMMHLSRFCEEIIIWNSQEFGFISIDDAFSTGSSIMPQKKNPDMAELIRGKTGRVYGDLVALLTVMKGLPLAYNKDMQEDKEAIFDAVDTLKGCLSIFISMFQTMKINKNMMSEDAKKGFLNATDLADYLVIKGLPFRSAHEISGKLVQYAEKKSKNFCELNLSEYKKMSPLFENDIFETISLTHCLAARKIIGGPAPEITKPAIAEIKDWLKKNNIK